MHSQQEDRVGRVVYRVYSQRGGSPLGQCSYTNPTQPCGKALSGMRMPRGTEEYTRYFSSLLPQSYCDLVFFIRKFTIQSENPKPGFHVMITVQHC